MARNKNKRKKPHPDKKRRNRNKPWQKSVGEYLENLGYAIPPKELDEKHPVIKSPHLFK